ncbi:dimethylaniline monooxygenase [N-oxide-forming] 4-like [Phascolarctos cinereus]
MADQNQQVSRTDPTQSELQEPRLQGFECKQVLVIGLGNSGGDVAVELSLVASQETTAKQVTIIGAGMSGLTSIKCCLEEGLEPTCFERSDDIGGLWKFTVKTSGHGKTQVYKSVVTNVTKEMSCYSDFPFQEDFPNYMNQAKMLEYLRSYAKHFDLLKPPTGRRSFCASFQTTVCSVTKSPDFSASGQWEVVTEAGGKQDTAVFDVVMICTGHYLNPHLLLHPFPGINKFQGQILHSREYRHPETFQGKRVLMIGLGNTGGDIAVELSRVASWANPKLDYK